MDGSFSALIVFSLLLMEHFAGIGAPQGGLPGAVPPAEEPVKPPQGSLPPAQID
jgi:hypothetical protein